MKRMIEQPHGNRSSVKAYRSGYLKAERREIEAGLKSGEIKLAAATNALELGVDIGGVDAIIMAGYPGTIASTRQRAGRAGRKSRESLAVLVASSAPLDQYLALHPEFILENSPEEALINPNNLLILLQHIQCAAFELPLVPQGALVNCLMKLSRTISTIWSRQAFCNIKPGVTSGCHRIIPLVRLHCEAPTAV